jgi:stage V sporulation protein S
VVWGSDAHSTNKDNPVELGARPVVELLKVSARSSPNSVAGAIAGILRERGRVDVQVIGAGALNQAVKAVAIARSFTADEGIDPVCIPAFRDIEIAGEGRTAICLTIEDRNRARAGAAAAREAGAARKASEAAEEHQESQSG